MLTDREGIAVNVNQASYARTVDVEASEVAVFDALATLQGVRGWWSPIVTGNPSPGKELVVGFEGLDEQIRLRVDRLERPTLVQWTCLGHASAPGWKDSVITFTVAGHGAASWLTLEHRGVPADDVSDGWDRFLASVAALVTTGIGAPYGGAAAQPPALRTALAYHQAWTTHDFGTARALLADNFSADVPVNSYRDADEFAAAVAAFGGSAESVELIGTFHNDDEALLLYDMRTPQIDRFRIAEQFTVRDGRITAIRHVHDTLPFKGVV